MPKRLTGATLALLLAGVTALAGGNSDATALVTDEPVELVTTFWGGAVKIQAFEDSAGAYMDQFPNVTIELIPVAGDYGSKILSMIAAGTPPDVININDPLTVALDGMLVELTDKMDDLGYFDPETGLWEGWFSILAADGFYDRGEPLYQAPLGTGTTVLAYNKAMFDAAGVAYPTADWTWDGEFLAAARKLSEPANQWGINGVLNNFAHRSIMKSYGGELYDAATTQFTGTSAAAVRGMQFAQDLIYRHGVHPTPAEQEAIGGNGVGAFANKSVAMQFLNTFEFPALYDLDDPWDIQFLPQGTDGSWAPIYGGRLAVLASSENQAHGWGFINLINGPIGQGFFSVSSGFNNPPLKSVAYGEAFMRGPEGAPPNNQIRVLALERAFVNQPILPNLSRINTLVNEQLDLLWDNQITAQVMVDTLQPKVQALLDEGF